ncbi:uncharacterized protein LOC115882277 isoform X2 [Sitophilus oryzae]|uniref:Uncharacterized protein LOC115882277 isoform X2 n=1 Tax=Sitophilus oryzae TaxID=7048 RepID=A0A6J2XXA3_SITOR|nr:uncharacterized protein LOC115882277 isoform X2 [Sitophilus oryzae]
MLMRLRTWLGSSLTLKNGMRCLNLIRLALGFFLLLTLNILNTVEKGPQMVSSGYGLSLTVKSNGSVTQKSILLIFIWISKIKCAKMDLSNINASNVSQLGVCQIESILQRFFTAEEWSLLTWFDKTRYRVLFVTYIRYPEFHSKYTLEEFIKERKEKPQKMFPEFEFTYNPDRKRKEEPVNLDPKDPNFKFPSSPKRMCAYPTITERELYLRTGTYLAPLIEGQVTSTSGMNQLNEPVPSTSGLITTRRYSASFDDYEDTYSDDSDSD